MNMHTKPSANGRKSAPPSLAKNPAEPPVQLPSLRALVFYALGLLLLFWTFVHIFSGFSDVADAKGGMPLLQGIGKILLNFWGFVASLVFGFVTFNPLAWLNGKRLVIGVTSGAMILGYFTMTAMSPLTLAVVEVFLPLLGFGAVPLSSPAGLLGLLMSFLLMPFIMAFAGSVLIVVLFSVAAGIFGVCVGVPVVLFRQILEFDNALHIYRYQARGLAAYIVRFVFWLRNERLPDAPDDAKGARFATKEEITRLHDPRGMGFGHIDGELLQLHTEKHVLIMASTRSGKGVTLIVPHLLRYEGSAFVLDPKGENAKATGRQRAALNDKVFFLDPFGISGKPKARFNPMSRLTPQNAEAESKALAAALFIPGEGERRDHWFNAAQQLFAALILFVYFSPEIPPRKKDLLAVRRRLLGNLKPTLESMLQIDDADGLLRDLALSFLETPEKEFGSIVSAAQRQTDILDNPAMIACLSASGDGPEVDFKEWHKGTMTVYLCLSAPKFPVFNRWLRLVLTSALDEMTDKLDPPPLPVCFMLDELATLGHFQPIENAIGLAAGYGVTLICVFQDVAQMRDLYKGRWASFIGNAGVRALFNLDDFDSAKYWSNFIGGHIVETHGRQEDLYGLSQGQNVGESVRPLLSPDELMLYFARNKMLVLPQGSRPIIAERKAFWNDAALNGLWDDPRQPAKRGPSAPPPHPLGTPPQRPAPPAAPPHPPAGGPKPKPPQPPTPAPSIPGTAMPSGVKISFDSTNQYQQPPVRSPSAPPPFRAQSAGATQPAARQETLVEVDRYEVGGVVYAMFSDGSVEVRSPSGKRRYASLAALREHAEREENAPPPAAPAAPTPPTATVITGRFPPDVEQKGSAPNAPPPPEQNKDADPLAPFAAELARMLQERKE